MANILVSEARTALENRKKDISDVSTANFLQWCNQINRHAYRIISGIDPELYISTSTITTSPGTSSYSLPVDFGADSLQNLGTGIYLTDQNNEIVETRLPRTAAGSQQLGYFLSGSNLQITPEPQTAKTYILRYIPLTAELTDTSDSMVIPEEFLEYVIEALDVKYSIWDEDGASESKADFRFARAMNELTRNIKRGPMIASLPIIDAY